MNLLKTLLLTFFICFTYCGYSNDSISQDLSRKNDSLFNLIQKEKNFKNLHIYITELLNNNYYANRPFVINYIENEILENPIFMRDTAFYANTINTYAICFLETDLDKSVEIARSGIDYIGKSENPEILEKIALLSSNLANALAALGHHNTRLKVFADIHPIILKTKNPLIIRNHNFKLGAMYYHFNELDKALEHLYNGIYLEEDFKWHPNFAGMTPTLIASVYFKKNELDSVRKYILIADKEQRKEIPLAYQSRINNLLGLTEAVQGNFDKSFEHIEKSYQLASSAKDTSELMFNQYIKGRIYTLQGKYQQAIESYNLAFDSFKQSDLDHYKNYVLMSLIDVYKDTNQHQKAYNTYQRLLQFFDDQKIRNQHLYAEELSYNMKFNEKVAEIDRLKISNEKAEITQQRNRSFIGGLGISLILILIVFFLVMKAQKRKKILAKQEYNLLEAKLEEEKNNRTIDEMKLLKQVEDRERNRIATDLHDSVGGLLSSIKIALYNYQETNNLSTEAIAHTDRVLEYVDETKQEINRIVYNLTPLIVEKFGLLEAIKQYCKKIQTDNFNVDLQIISVPTKIVVEDEIMVYRIIQEVLHNIVKHANATKTLLQIQTDSESGMVIISIEDNGKGMNLEEATTKGGLGLRSLYSRVQNLNGRLKIESFENEGTAVYISCYPRSLEVIA